MSITLSNCQKFGSGPLVRIIYSHTRMTYGRPSCLYRQLRCLDAFLDIKDASSSLSLLPLCLITVSVSAVHFCQRERHAFFYWTVPEKEKCDPWAGQFMLLSNFNTVEYQKLALNVSGLILVFYQRYCTAACLQTKFHVWEQKSLVGGLLYCHYSV